MTTDWNGINQKKKEMYAEIPQETIERYEGVSAIYGIYVDGELVYIGKSTNTLGRWVAHKINTLFNYGQKDYKEAKYEVLRQVLKSGHSVSCDVLEYCNEDELSTREKEWIKREDPILNGGRTSVEAKSWQFMLRLSA